jgi:hypothetical protein
LGTANLWRLRVNKRFHHRLHLVQFGHYVLEVTHDPRLLDCVGETVGKEVGLTVGFGSRWNFIPKVSIKQATSRFLADFPK